MSTTSEAHVTVMPVPLANRLASRTTTSASPLKLSKAYSKAKALISFRSCLFQHAIE